MNYENIIYDLVLYHGGNFSNINKFVDKTISCFNIKSYSQFEDIINNIDKLIFDAKANNDFCKLVILEDLKNIRLDDYVFISKSNFNQIIESSLQLTLNLYKSIGLNVPKNFDLNLCLCDQFPAPFNNNKGIALSPDSYDEEKFGIKKGIYFLNSKVSFYQSRLLIPHELLHQIISKNDGSLLARGLEEGLCELIGGYYINSILFNKTVAYNYIKHRRFKYGITNQKFKIYTDYMRLAWILYEQVGLDGIVDIINGGRKTIKDIESQLINGKIITNCNNNFSNLAIDDKLFRVIENEVVSPIAYYVIKLYNNEKNILDFANKNNIDIDLCRKAFLEIQNRVYGCVIENDLFEFSDINQIKINNNIRYEL